jgi:hypothetical protein
VILLASFATLIAGASCIDEKCVKSRDNYQYDLESTVKFTPLQTQYVIGDTVELSFKFPNPILDRNHNTLEVIENVDFRHGWWMSKLDNVESVSLNTSGAIDIIRSGTTIGALQTNTSIPFDFIDGKLEKLPDGSFASNYLFS